jgi:hypothetical protein
MKDGAMHRKPYLQPANALRDGVFPASRRMRDPVLRIAGLGLLAVAFAACHGLLRSVHAGVPHAATIFEFIVGATGFLGLTLGGALTALGGHLLDPVAVSRRWRGSEG